MSDQVFWFATRGAGIGCWLAATASILVGFMLSSRVLGVRPTIPWLTDLHRFFGAMAMIFLGIHMVTLSLDEFVSFGLADLVVPGRAEVAGLSRWGLAWGVVAAWILAVVEVSSLLKKRIPAPYWHTIHLTSLVAAVLGSVHGIQSGTDTDSLLLISLSVCALSAVLLVAGVRVVRLVGDRAYRRSVGPAGTEPDLRPEPAPRARPEPVFQPAPRTRPEPVFRPVPQHRAELRPEPMLRPPEPPRRHRPPPRPEIRSARTRSAPHPRPRPAPRPRSAR
ncbi:MAG: hypothetical protein ACK5RL_07810 [Acidimicrobiales bacterium]